MFSVRPGQLPRWERSVFMAKISNRPDGKRNAMLFYFFMWICFNGTFRKDTAGNCPVSFPVKQKPGFKSETGLKNLFESITSC